MVAPGRRSVAARGALAWVLGTLAAVVATLFLAAAVAGLVPPYESRAPFLAVHAGAWVVTGGASVIVLSRVLLGGTASARRGIEIVVIGALAAGSAAAGLTLWTEARFGYYDPEFLGPTWHLPLSLGLSAIALASAAVTAGPRRLYPAGIAALGMLDVSVLTIFNVSGRGEHVGEVSWGLAGGFAVATVFLVAATWRALMPARQPRS